MDEFLTVKEVAENWGITTRRVVVLCTDGRIKGAKKIGTMWFIPKGTSKPADNRFKENKEK